MCAVSDVTGTCNTILELHDIRNLRDDISPCKCGDITKYHGMHNNGDYGTSFHYMYIQSSYSVHLCAYI